MALLTGTSVFNSNNVAQSLTGGRSGFPSPFLDVASLAMPDQNKNVLDWCEYVWDAQETYRQAQERKIAYFLTNIEIESADANEALGDDEKDKWKNFLLDTLGVLNVIRKIDRDAECYGNGFATINVPFKRMLVCPKCQSQFPLSVVYNMPDFKFEWKIPQFIATCPNCETGSGYRGPFEVNDLPEDLESNLSVKLWPPQEIEILHDLYTDETAYIWKIPEDYKKQVRSGHLFHLERASMPVIRAIHRNNLFRFHPEVMFHMREPAVSGRRTRGWGVSRILVNFRQIWYVQVLRRYNEAIGLDYVIPFRLLTPEARTGSGVNGGGATDPLRTMNMGDFGGSVLDLVGRRRRDPAGWHFLPFPVKYQTLGGDANELAPKDILDQGYEVLLNGSGIPMELYRGTLQLQAAPVALRLFEATNIHLVHNNNDFLRWLVKNVAQILTWEQVKASMSRVLHADDFNKQMAQLQLMMGQAISQTTGLKTMGLDWDSEQRQIAEEARRQAQIQAEIQEEMEQAAFGEQIARGQPAAGPGGMPAGAEGGAMAGDPAAQQMSPVTGLIQGGNVPQSLDDMVSTAESLAAELLGLPESQKDSELRALKDKNETLHALVKSKMESMRNRARTAGASMLLSQQGGA